MKNPWYLLLASSFFLFLTACGSEYQRLEKRELASGKVVKELFFGLELEMTQKEFFVTCWIVNKKLPFTTFFNINVILVIAMSAFAILR